MCSHHKYTQIYPYCLPWKLSDDVLPYWTADEWINIAPDFLFSELTVGENPGCVVGVWVLACSRSLSFEGDWLRALSVSSGLLCNFVAVYSTCVTTDWLIDWVRLNVPPTQYRSYVTIYFTIKSLYTIVHLLLEEFKISLKSSLGAQSLCHRTVLESESGVLNYLTLKLESPPQKKTRTLHPWWKQILGLTSLNPSTFQRLYKPCVKHRLNKAS